MTVRHDARGHAAFTGLNRDVGQHARFRYQFALFDCRTFRLPGINDNAAREPKDCGQMRAQKR